MDKDDKELIYKARKLHWDEIDNLIKQAKTKECRDNLELIQKQKYHNEEFEIGLL